MGKRLTQEEFIARAIAKHGKGRFDYSMVHYTYCRTPVIIKCNVCGTTWKNSIDNSGSNDDLQ
jgi:hypothetical protein